MEGALFYDKAFEAWNKKTGVSKFISKYDKCVKANNKGNTFKGVGALKQHISKMVGNRLTLHYAMQTYISHVYSVENVDILNKFIENKLKRKKNNGYRQQNETDDKKEKGVGGAGGKKPTHEIKGKSWGGEGWNVTPFCDGDKNKNEKSSIKISHRQKRSYEDNEIKLGKRRMESTSFWWW